MAGQSSGGGGKGKKGGGGSTSSSDAIVLVKLTSSGAFDTSFGDGGLTIHDATVGDDNPWPGALGVQSTGRIVVGSRVPDLNENWSLTAYASDGAVDSSFGRVVVADADLRGMAIDASDRILGCGSEADAAGDIGFVLTRHASDGSIDTSFGSGGTASLGLSEESLGGPILVQGDGYIVAGLNIIGTDSYYRAQPVRFDADGALDTDYGTAGFGDVLEGSSTHYGLFGLGFIDGSGNVVFTGATQDAAADAWLVARYSGN